MRGGYLHNNLLVGRLDAAWRSVGASTTRETAISNDHGQIVGYIDLLVRHGSNLFAVEVELSAKRVARDVEKALALKVTELWIVAPNVHVRRSINRTLQRLALDSGQGLILVLSLGQALQRVRLCFSMFSRANAGRKQIETERNCRHGG